MASLSSLLGLPPPPVTIAAVGSGGKTSCLKALARSYARDGQSTLLTTTTHMRLEPEVTLSPSLPVLEAVLHDRGFLFAGTPGPEGKIGPLPPEQLDALSRQAQVVLVEADGSKGLPMKAPAAWEPVLPPNTGHVLVLLGLSCLGRPLQAVCHRWPLAAQQLGCPPEAVVTPQLAARLLRSAYLAPLDARSLRYTVVLNQAELAGGADIQALRAALAPAHCVPVSLKRFCAV